MKIIFKILVFVLFLVIGAFCYFGVRYYSILNKVHDIKGTKTITIAKGESAQAIIQNLTNENIISSSFYFSIYLRETGLDKRFKAGDYAFSGELSMRQVADLIASGEALDKDIKFLIKEGENSSSIGEKFAQADLFSKEDFLGVVGFPMVDYSTASNYPVPTDFSPKFSFLKDKPSNVSLEGYLFPDTYIFYKDSTPDGVVLKMLENFNRKLTLSMREEIARQGKTIYEIVTMASLIEKEVRSADDMKMVSGIFYNRIRNRQRLESCATLAYILGVNKAQYSLEDTNIESPYNTYRNYGLPPGPIANPGIKAITAAIYPQDTEYNYFLTSSDGTTVFAKTFEEHVRNKAKYLK